VYVPSNTGYFTIASGRIELLPSIGSTASVLLGNANVFNNAASSSVHFTVKGQSSASLINTRSDQNTVGFGQAIGTDEQTTVQIQPAAAGDTCLVLKGHASQTTTSNLVRIQSSAGSYYGYITMGAHFVSTIGSATTPGHTFYNDTNTGFYQVSSDKIGTTTGGVQRETVDSV